MYTRFRSKGLIVFHSLARSLPHHLTQTGPASLPCIRSWFLFLGNLCHNRWWRSFLTSGSTGVWVFAYSAVYFTYLQSTMLATYVLYFGYMALLSLGLSLLTGCIGFYSCLWFTRKIYSSIKVCFAPCKGEYPTITVCANEWRLPGTNVKK